MDKNITLVPIGPVVLPDREYNPAAGSIKAAQSSMHSTASFTRRPGGWSGRSMRIAMPPD